MKWEIWLKSLNPLNAAAFQITWPIFNENEKGINNINANNILAYEYNKNVH